MSKKPFNVMGYFRQKAANDPEFQAMVDAEIAALELEESIVALRKRHGLTQAAVAAKMGVTQSAIAQLEKKGAAAKMEIRTLVKMASAAGGRLRISIDAAPRKPTPRGKRRKVAAVG